MNKKSGKKELNEANGKLQEFGESAELVSKVANKLKRIKELNKKEKGNES